MIDSAPEEFVASVIEAFRPHGRNIERRTAWVLDGRYQCECMDCGLMLPIPYAWDAWTCGHCGAKAIR